MSIGDLPERIKSIGLITVGITAFLEILVKFLEVLSQLLRIIPKPISKFFAYAISLIVPNGILVWYYFYLAGLYSHRLSEAGFFLSLVAQLAGLVSFYAFLWGKWILPRLRSVVEVKQDEQANTSNSKANNNNDDGGLS